MRRHRNVKIVATLGPASNTYEMLHKLHEAGADVFRLNMSHGSHPEIAERHAMIRKLEADLGTPIAILADLQGPKLRVGVFANDEGEDLSVGAPFRLDLSDAPGDATRVQLPHREIFDALEPGAHLLVNDGKIKLRVKDCGADFADCEVVVGGVISNRKGVNVPDVVLPLAALSDKDRKDLEFVCELGIDWLALSFVQRPADVEEARALAKGRAFIMSKIEKPNAVKMFDEILKVSDGIMVARGDLGVELPVQNVPPIQKRLVRKCRVAAKPVIVATQMLESMIESPMPTRAEVSDVATAIYEGADAIMLSAEVRRRIVPDRGGDDDEQRRPGGRGGSDLYPDHRIHPQRQARERGRWHRRRRARDCRDDLGRRHLLFFAARHDGPAGQPRTAPRADRRADVRGTDGAASGAVVGLQLRRHRRCRPVQTRGPCGGKGGDRRRPGHKRRPCRRDRRCAVQHARFDQYPARRALRRKFDFARRSGVAYGWRTKYHQRYAMDPDLFFVIGILVVGFSVPAIISAFSEGRAPRAAAIMILIGGGLMSIAIYNKPTGYSISGIPDVFVNVVGRYIN